MNADKTYQDKDKRELHTNTTSYNEQILKANPH